MYRYGIGASSAGPAQTATIGSECTGVSTIPPSAPAMVGLGDYLDIAILQPGTGTSTTVTIPPVHWSPKRRLDEGSRIFHNHGEGPY